jgi:hypothetical protein
MVLVLAGLAFTLLLVISVKLLGSRQESALGFLVFVTVLVMAAKSPKLGIHLILFFTLLGDVVLIPWYPFAKDLSSRESLLFLSNSMKMSPLEIIVAVTTISWYVSLLGGRKRRLVKGPVFWAVVSFTAFTVFGYAYGVGRGGDLRIGLFEGRSIFLILPIYMVLMNLFDRDDLRRLMWTCVAAITGNSLIALQYLNALAPARAKVLEDLGEHNASVQFALIFILTLLMWFYGGGTKALRWVLLLACVPVALAFLAAQRRSAMVGLIVALLLICMSAWWRARAKLFVLGPLLFVGVALYSAAFWNATSSAGFPAQAIKTVVEPKSVSRRDASSDVYRQIENFDLNFTIRDSPVFGIGFGQKFERPVPLADISFFEFYEYIPHNAMLWIWIKTGFLGFASMLGMMALSVAAGASAMTRERDRTELVMLLAGVCSVVMFCVFAFVDIAWVPRTLVFLPFAFALCTQGNTPTLKRSRDPAQSGAVLAPLIDGA